eukprot:651495-Alexandrium_andersonii.AAC.1
MPARPKWFGLGVRSSRSRCSRRARTMSRSRHRHETVLRSRALVQGKGLGRRCVRAPVRLCASPGMPDGLNTCVHCLGLLMRTG